LENDLVKSVIVTGAAQGIGYAIAERFLKDGARVMISDINETAIQEAQTKLSPMGEVEIFVGNVADRIDVHNLLAKTIGAFDKVDVLVNNAGIVHAADFLDLAEEDFDRVLSVNLKGVFLAGQAVCKHFVERVKQGEAPGCVINISSVNDTLALPGQIPYTVSKGAVKQLTRVMAVSLAPYGIRVNAIGPGSIKTEMLASVLSDKAAEKRILERTPMGRVGEPSEIASVAAFLASKDASYITGEVIYADGGRMPLGYSVQHDD
jgi:glucose 1-dehydrogenase